MPEATPEHRLETALARHDRLAVAVSGGVDSMTLAHLAREVLGSGFEAFHAVSPAVPPEASARVRRHAEDHRWPLQVIDAGEFRDPAYLANPVDRCYFCKFNLYGTVRRLTEAPIASGTNLDDLDDYRPGLKAARGYGVVHPFVEAGIDKAEVRALARRLGLDDLAELPAAPCLSSRIETGLTVRAEDLGLVHAVERLLAARLSCETVRCRVRRQGIAIELDPASLSRLQAAAGLALRRELTALCRRHGRREPPTFGPYRRGSAFLGAPTDGV